MKSATKELQILTLSPVVKDAQEQPEISSGKTKFNVFSEIGALLLQGSFFIPKSAKGGEIEYAGYKKSV